MTPKIPDIINAAALVCSTTAKKVLTLSLNTERLQKARLFSVHVAASYGYTPAQITKETGMSDIEVRTLASKGRTKMSSSEVMQKKVDLMMQILAVSTKPHKTVAKAPQRPPVDNGPHNVGFPIYTADEEQMIKKACIEADVFMQTYGQGEGTRKAITNGYGYYQNV